MEFLINILLIYGWIFALIILIPIVIFILCWYIWVFSPNQDARKKAAEFSNKTQIAQHKLAEIWFRVGGGGVIFFGIIIIILILYFKS